MFYFLSKIKKLKLCKRERKIKYLFYIIFNSNLSIETLTNEKDNQEKQGNQKDFSHLEKNKEIPPEIKNRFDYLEKCLALKINEIEKLYDELKKKDEIISKLHLEKSNLIDKSSTELEKKEQTISNIMTNKEIEINDLHAQLQKKDHLIDSLSKESEKRYWKSENVVGSEKNEIPREKMTQFEEYDKNMNELYECKKTIDQLKKTLLFKENEASKLNTHINQQQENLLAYQKELENLNNIIEHLKEVINSKSEDIEKYKISFEELNNQFQFLKNDLNKDNKINDDRGVKLKMNENPNPDSTMDSKKLIEQLSYLLASGVCILSIAFLKKI